jgi:hypothetical protein
MSRGLGSVERTILEALQATQRPYVALWRLMVLVDGQIRTLNQEAHHWTMPICSPHPKRRLAIGLWVDHDASCYPPEPSRSRQEAVSRAVRSLARKGLVRCEYEGDRPKRLLVYLPSADRSQLPNARRESMEILAFVKLGTKPPYRRPGSAKRWYVDNPSLIKG